MTRLTPLALAAGVLVALPTQAAIERTGYYIAPFGLADGHQVEWNTTSGVAQRTDDAGVATATFTQNAAGERTLTLDVPRARDYLTMDACGQEATARDVTTAYTYAVVGAPRALDNTRLATVGYTYWVTGCTAGTRVDWSAVPATYAGRPMRARLPLSDIGPGTRLTGFSEEAVAQDASGQFQPLFPSQDTVVFSGLPGTATFERSGHSYPVRLDANGWLVFSLPGGERAYTRMSLGLQRGGEIWLYADQAGDQAQWMRQTTMVTPQPGSSFDTARQAARYWLSPIESSDPALRYFGWQLKPDLTGSSCGGPVLAPEYCTTPLLSWRYSGDVTIDRSWRGGTQLRQRHWQALARLGSTQWVMEREDLYNLDGSYAGPFIAPRVIGYTDLGFAGGAALSVAPKPMTVQPPRHGFGSLP
ncbi:MAG: Ig-like domain-containing protein [Proteobacteria bacterium]|nr:Ig-like domain-containing protein [Pseudomonadota bacterium]